MILRPDIICAYCMVCFVCEYLTVYTTHSVYRDFLSKVLASFICSRNNNTDVSVEIWVLRTVRPGDSHQAWSTGLALRCGTLIFCCIYQCAKQRLHSVPITRKGLPFDLFKALYWTCGLPPF